ncbi:MAG: hypothetical protein M3S32_06255 [Acidobacteriota bacterium]|nr:hypothetical protein [Acidobacteriota bacterium]
MGSTDCELKCRLEKSGHSSVVVFHREDGQEVLVLPAERLDALALQKLESNDVRCAVAGPAPDGTSALQVMSSDGALLFQQRVWIGSGTWSRILRAP